MAEHELSPIGLTYFIDSQTRIYEKTIFTLQELPSKDHSKEQPTTKENVAKGPKLPKMASGVKDLSGNGPKLPQMKPPGDILKLTKRKRVKLGNIYANPHKKRRFKPKPHLQSLKATNITEDIDNKTNVSKTR